jgi:hypothetical protein
MKLVLLVCAVAAFMAAASASDKSRDDPTTKYLNPPPFIGSLLEFVCLPFRFWMGREELGPTDYYEELYI